MPFKSEKQRRWMHVNKPEMAKDWEKKLAYSDKKEKKMKREQRVRELIKKMVREELAGLDEAAKRDYKAEYKKFQSSDKSKKYRAELNKYNRQKGTYGNGDGKDASHKGGKIVGFEKESVNRGRAEKSRLKKEGKLSEGISVADTRFVGKFVIHILSSGSEMRSAILSKKNNSKYATKDKKDLKTLWDLAGKYKGKEIKEGKLTEAKETIFDVAAKVMKDSQNYNYKSKKGMVKVDMQTANLLTKVFKKVSPKMKKHLAGMGESNPAGLVQTLWAAVK